MAKKSKNKYDNLYNFSDTNIYMEKYKNDQEQQNKIKAKKEKKELNNKNNKKKTHLT